jgi:hypothetical protein
VFFWSFRYLISFWKIFLKFSAHWSIQDECKTSLLQRCNVVNSINLWVRSFTCDVISRFTNWFLISVKRCSTCDAKNATNWANHAILWIIVLSTSLSQLITDRFFLLFMIFSMHHCCSDARYMLLSRRLT